MPEEMVQPPGVGGSREYIDVGHGSHAGDVCLQPSRGSFQDHEADPQFARSVGQLRDLTGQPESLPHSSGGRLTDELTQERRRRVHQTRRPKGTIESNGARLQSERALP
jgi:hypothetical protein